MPAPVTALLHDYLESAGNEAGGWPYLKGKASRIEPTCWALLALRGSWQRSEAEWTRAAARHIDWLAGVQRPAGLLVEQQSAPANFTSNGLAACVLASLGEAQPVVSRLLTALVAAKGISVGDHDERQDNRLQGWPWIADTFSWLEPTCWCVLALKKAGANVEGADARIAEAEKLVVNRTCEGGGWNYGNASAVGQDLRPYVPTTALALIALQNRRGTAAVDASLAWLNASQLKEPTAMALALAAIALRIHGGAIEEVHQRMERDADRAVRVGNVQSLAMMLYALSSPQHGFKAFTI